MSGEAREEGNKRRPASVRPLIPLILVLLVAAALRFTGLAWGLPNDRHYFSYHPDEVMVLAAAQRVNLFAGRWNPGFYNYGTLLITVISLTTQFIDAYAPLHAFPHEMARMTLIGRTWVALAGVATVYVVYLIARRIGGPRAGLLAAAALAVTPMHAVHSHFVTVDVPATLFVAIALYNALRYRDVGLKAAIACGIATGLAAGTKYNAGLVVLAGWTAIALIRERPLRERWKAAGILTSAAALAFLAATPGFLLDSASFWRDFGYEANHVRTGHGLVFINTGPGWWYHIATNMGVGIGPYLPIAVAVLFIFGQKRRANAGRDRRPWFILGAFAIPYFAVISLAAVRFQRYDIPLLPVLAVGAGVALASAMRAMRGVDRYLAAGVLALGIGATFVAAAQQVSTMAAPRTLMTADGTLCSEDPRDCAADWLNKLPRTAKVGLTRRPWFFSPPVSVYNAGPQTEVAFNASPPANIVFLPDGASQYPAPAPDYVVISDYEYGDALRLSAGIAPESLSQVHGYPVSGGDDLPAEARQFANLWNWLNTNYTVANMFIPEPHAFGISSLKRKLLPHDSTYSYPTLIVFQRRITGG